MKRLLVCLFFTYTFFCAFPQFLFGESSSQAIIFEKENGICLRVTTPNINYGCFNRCGLPLLALVFTEDGHLVPDRSWRSVPLNVIENAYFHNHPMIFGPNDIYELDVKYGSPRFQLKNDLSYYVIVILKKPENDKWRLVYSNILHFKIIAQKMSVLESVPDDSLPNSVKIGINDEIGKVEAEDALSFRSTKPIFYR